MSEPLVSQKPATTEAALELVVAGALWGFGFIATVWALRSMGPLAITGWRFLIASVVALAISFVHPRSRRWITWDQFRLAFVPGILICLTIFIQTWGMKYTTATKSGFITTLYVLMVPFLELLLLRRRLHRLHMVYAILALVGVALICDLGASSVSNDPRAHWNIGDLLTLGCAIAASFHIVWFGKIQARIGSAFVFNGFQSFWAGLAPLALSFIMEPLPHPSFSDLSLYGFMSLAFGSTLIAFALQVRAQKTLSPSVASLLFLLESPFATFFAVMLLGEHLKTSQWIGAGLILLAAGLSTALSTET